MVKRLGGWIDRWMRPFLLIISGLNHLQSSVNMMNSSRSFISSVLPQLDTRPHPDVRLRCWNLDFCYGFCSFMRINSL